MNNLLHTTKQEDQEVLSILRKELTEAERYKLLGIIDTQEYNYIISCIVSKIEVLEAKYNELYN